MMRTMLDVRGVMVALVFSLIFPAGGAMAGPSMLVDMITGRVLEHEQAFDPWYPASLTKLMTTYVTFRAVKAGEIRFDSPVTISDNATREPPSKMGYERGTVLTFDDAIKILMVKSANDVATAVAESLAGSVQAFAARMNAEAKRLGMTGTHFVNAHGLHADEQFTTARDLAILAMTLRNEFPQHAHYFDIEAIQDGDNVIETHNNLIMRFDGANGMKTGYTCPSGFNLIATAERDGRRLLAVVIGAETVEARADKAANLLGGGFTKSEATAPFLGELRAKGTEPLLPVNLRPVICTQEHWKKVSEARGPSGQPAYKSSYLKDPTRDPVAIPITAYANVPIPTPRPDYVPEKVAEGG